jgi:hypothetical protein
MRLIAVQVVPSKLMKVLRKIEELFDQSSNYKNYRAALAKRQPPILPFQGIILFALSYLRCSFTHDLTGVYLTDLTFIEEQPDRLPNGMVNFDKVCPFSLSVSCSLLTHTHFLSLSRSLFCSY